MLFFRAGQERGFVTSYDRGRRCGAQDAWFPEPEQHGARRDVLGEWGGVEVVAGTKVDVVFARGGEIRGMVVCPRGLTADRLEVWVRRASSMASPAPEGDENGPVVVAAVDTLGAFVVRGVDAGRCRVEFRRKGGRMPLHAIDDVDVRLDEMCADPRLARVDLAPELDAVTLTVIDPVGAPLHGAVAVLRAGAGFEVIADSNASRVLAESAEAPAQLHLLLPRGLGAPELGDPLIVVGRSGFVPEVLRPPFSDQVVRLTPYLSLTVRPRQPFVAEDGDLGFWLRLHRADAPRTLEVLWSVELPEDSWGDTTPASLTPDDPLFVTAPGPGRYELDVLVRERVGSRFPTRAEDQYVGTGVFVDIAATGATVVIDIPLDLAAFRAPR